MNLQRLLVLCPHIDDESFGPAGTIARVNAAEGEVMLAVFSHGGAGIKFDGEKYLAYKNVTRLEEFRSAVKILGGATLRFFQEGADQFHHKLDVVPVFRLVDFIETCVFEFSPTAMLLPFPRWEQDHDAVHRAGKIVSRPYFFSGPVLSYSVGNEMDFGPNVFVRLDDTAAMKKIIAISRYKTQLTGMPLTHPCSPRMAQNQLRRWGSLCNTAYAEGFVCERVVV